MKDNESSSLGGKNGASSGKLNQITPKMSLLDDNEYILALIGDMNALKREIEQIRNVKQCAMD